MTYRIHCRFVSDDGDHMKIVNRKGMLSAVFFLAMLLLRGDVVDVYIDRIR